MIRVIEEIFKNSGYVSCDEIRRDIFGEKSLSQVYINSNDEMYFVIPEDLDGKVLQRIVKRCADVERNEGVKRRYKSNWVILIVVKINGTLTWDQTKEILCVEENKYFCRKYVFWYSEDEKEEMGKLCDSDYSVENMEDIIKRIEYFSQFKNNQNIGYDCLSRLFIKLPFLNLSAMSVMKDSITDYIKKNTEKIKKGLFEKLRDEELATIEEYIDLDSSEICEIEAELKKLDGGK